jgi:hypothetical protein
MSSTLGSAAVTDTLAALAASAAAAIAAALDPSALAAFAAADAAAVDVLNWRGHALPFGHSKQLFWFQVSKSGSAVFEERYFPGGHLTQYCGIQEKTLPELMPYFPEGQSWHPPRLATREAEMRELD